MKYRKNTDTTKYCPKCSTVKSRLEFSKNRCRADGLQGLCKVCNPKAKLKSVHKNRDHYRAMNLRHQKERRLRSPEAIREEKRREYVKHRERYAMSRAVWFAAHPEARHQMRVRDRLKRRALEAAAFIETVEPVVVWERDSGLCHICGETISFYAIELDHVVPISRGGKHSYENIKASHGDCNRWKHKRLLSELPVLVSGSTPHEEVCEK